MGLTGDPMQWNRVLPMFRIFFLALALSGCRRGFLDRDKTCEYDVYDWWDGLSTHVNQDKDAEFDYSPDPAAHAWVSGSYDPSPGSGEFNWQLDYAEGYFLQAAAVSGYGTAYFGGDLDVLYERLVRDSLGEDVHTRVREKRSKCNGSRRTVDLDDDTVMETTYQITSDDTVVSRTTQDIGSDASYLLLKTERSDHSIESVLTIQQGGVSQSDTTVEDISGLAQAQWGWDDGTDRVEGATDRLFNGKEISNYEWHRNGTKQADVHSETNYDGSGTAEYSYADGESCTFTYDSGRGCDYECSDGSSGDCS